MTARSAASAATASTWVNPLTGSDVLPERPGDLLPAVIAYWEDELNYWRGKRPRKLHERQQKQARVDLACERLVRYRRARERFAWFPKNYERENRLTLQLATDDLSPVMRAASSASDARAPARAA